jgi:hypothetical protein
MRPECWLTLALFVIPAGGVIAQEPQRRQQDQAPYDRLPALLTAKPVQPDPKDDDLRKLLVARYNESVAEMKVRYTEFQAGKTTIDSMLGASQRLLKSGLELSGNPQDRIKLLEQFLEMAKVVERIDQALVEAGRLSAAELHEARHLRIDTEIQLLRARREASKGKDK